MCGIVGYIGKNVKRNLIISLKKLEYRGYDSSGIAYKEYGKISQLKKQGYIQNLEERIDFNNDLTSVGIAHTRWATHGIANDENAHPHLSNHKIFSLVHNGIIENYAEIKADLMKKGYKFYSETDSEVIVNLLEDEYIKTQDVVIALKDVCKILKGSYALCIITNFDDNIYMAKNNMPLYIDAQNKFIASDINAFNKKTNEIYSLENNEFAVINAKDLEFYNYKGKISKKNLKITAKIEGTLLNGYSHYMLKEIKEIKGAIERTLTNFKENKKLESFIPSIDKIYLIACGTAYHACLNGEKFLIKYAKINAQSFVASEFYTFPPIIDKNTLCVFVSQSGETADTINCLKLAKKKKAKTLVITNVQTSTITRLSNINYFTFAGPEIAVASTKAYNTQIAVLYKLTEQICKIKKLKIPKIKDINSFKIDEINKLQNDYKNLAEIIKKYEKVFFLGRNFDYITSNEGSLKLKEITYINCSSLASGELKHGTLALVDEKTLIIATITEKKLLEKSLNNVNEILARGGNVIFLSPYNEEIKQKLHINTTPNTLIDYINLPKIKEDFYQFISIIPLQYFAYYVSISKNLNPDKPRNLAKSVTVE